VVAICKRTQLARIRCSTEVQEPPLLCQRVPKYRVVGNTAFIVIINLYVQFNVEIRVIRLRTGPGRNHFAIKVFRNMKLIFGPCVCFPGNVCYYGSHSLCTEGYQVVNSILLRIRKVWFRISTNNCLSLLSFSGGFLMLSKYPKLSHDSVLLWPVQFIVRSSKFVRCYVHFTF
jgi:hypothetical protein